jgi:hypothetical protein
MGNERSERCTNHGVRGCFVCNPLPKTLKQNEITFPPVPEFPNDEALPVVDSLVSPKIAADQPQTTLEPGSHEEKVVLASRKYADACTEHMKSQREVAKLREDLHVASGLQEKAAKEREAARRELQELLVVPQEVVQ